MQYKYILLAYWSGKIPCFLWKHNTRIPYSKEVLYRHVEDILSKGCSFMVVPYKDELTILVGEGMLRCS